MHQRELRISQSRSRDRLRAASRFPARPSSNGRIALLTPYFPLFDGTFPDDYRTRQEQNAQQLADLLTGWGFEVHHLGLTDSESLAVEHGKRLASVDPHVVLVAPVMAAPATYSVPAVTLIDRPSVVCQVVRRARIGADYDEIDATEDSTLLGCIMACSGLRRANRQFAHVMLTDLASQHHLARVLYGAIASRSLVGKRIGLLGATLEGYVDVELSAAELDQIGLVGVEVPGHALMAGFESVDETDVADARVALAASGLSIALDDGSVQRDLKLAVALERIVASYELDALSFNCHGDLFRRSPIVGIPGCLAGSVIASSECPVTCTGDVSTIVALLVAQQFTPKVQYCEPYTFEYASGRVILGSCGIGNLATASSSTNPSVCVNYAYPGSKSPGCCVRFGLEAGAATLLAYVPREVGGDEIGLLLSMSGSLSDDFHQDMHGPNAVLQLSGDDPTSSLSDWAIEGPAHHLALAGADISVEIATLSAFSRIRHRHVG